MGWWQLITEIVQLVYFIASIALVIGLFIGMKQLKQMKADSEIGFNQLSLMREDYKTRNQRESIGKSIEYLNWYATDFMPKQIELVKKVREGDFGAREPIPRPKEKTFFFDSSFNVNDNRVENNIKVLIRINALSLMNELEFFSAAMCSGLADENLAFNPLGKDFCEFVENHYELYCYSRRKENDLLYSHTITLYNIWDKRLKHLDLQKKKEKIEKELENSTNDSIQAIGTK